MSDTVNLFEVQAADGEVLLCFTVRGKLASCFQEYVEEFDIRWKPKAEELGVGPVSDGTLYVFSITPMSLRAIHAN